MTVRRALLRTIGLISALFGSASNAAASPAPHDPVAGFGPERLLADSAARARFAADPEAALRGLGIDPGLFRLPEALPAGDVARLGSGWGGEGASLPDMGGAPVAQVAVYGPPPMPTPMPSASPTPRATSTPTVRPAKTLRRRRVTRHTSPLAPPAPVYGPPPGR